MITCRFQDITADGCCSVTWDMVMSDRSIKSIQEPIAEMFISKHDFYMAYRDFLDTLDARDMSSFVDFFWRRSPLDKTCLEFIDKDSRLDIYEFLIEMELIPEMSSVHDGSWKFK